LTDGAATPDPNDAIGLCLAGLISPEIALARLLLAELTGAEIAAQVEARRPDPPTPRWEALARLLRDKAGVLDRLSAEVVMAGRAHGVFAPGGTIGRVAAFFDGAAARAPEAGVAFYSLGDPTILAAATAEIVDWLGREGLLGQGETAPPPDMLDLGCGIGRMAAALAPRCRSVLGLDVSPGMVAEARRRCAGPGNVRFEVTAGEDLAALPGAAFDLVLAVDSFPYMVQVGRGVADRHVEGAARVLRPGGALAILNLSYGRGVAADRADVGQWAERYGFRVARAGERPFKLWDGAIFVLQRQALKPQRY
jgi:SAM-dependent methyltransferase